jgi:hypothetical protein
MGYGEILMDQNIPPIWYKYISIGKCIAQIVKTNLTKT